LRDRLGYDGAPIKPPAILSAVPSHLLSFGNEAMPEASRIECPHCAAKLKIKSALYGKKIRCPKCEEPFLAEAPAAEEDNFLDNLDSFGGKFGEPIATAPALPARSKGAKKSSQSAGDSDDEPRPKKKAKRRAADGDTMHWITWPLFGFGGGLLAGAIWVAVGYFFHREVGYIAWAVGLFVGLGVRIAAGDRAGLGAGLMAIAISIAMILTSKFVVAYLMTVQFVNSVAAKGETDDDAVKFSLAMDIVTEEALKGAKAGGKRADIEFPEAEVFKELPKELREKTEARWKQMSAQEQKEYRNKEVGVQQLPPFFIAIFAFIGSFRALDLLWFGFASFTAFRIASGARDS
jgi:predicted Zn finger-like uncharacterized protein